MIIQVVIPVWQAYYSNALANAALECGTSMTKDGVIYVFYVDDLPHWLHIYFKAMAEMSRQLILSKITERRYFRVVDWNVRCWVQVEGAHSLRYGLDD